MKICQLIILFSGFLFALMLNANLAFAQSSSPSQEPDNVAGVSDQDTTDSGLLDPNLYMGIQEAHGHFQKLRPEEVKPDNLPSLFFTLWQHRLLQEAKFRFRTRPPEGYELDKDPGDTRPSGIRELSLGGILYKNSDNWIVWLNGERITPKAIPKEIIDIRVSGEFVEMKWFDSSTNLIFPIRLRPHQRFNLDSRIFLPGSSKL